MIEQMKEDETLRADTKEIIDLGLEGSDEVSDEEEDDEEDDLFGEELNNKHFDDNQRLRSSMINLSKLSKSKRSGKLRALDFLKSKNKEQSLDSDLEEDEGENDDDQDDLSETDSAVEQEIFDLKDRTNKLDEADSDNDF